MSTDNHSQATQSQPADQHGDSGTGGIGCDLREAANELLEQTKGLRAELAKQAREHPLAAFGVAFAAGVLLARALRR